MIRILISQKFVNLFFVFSILPLFLTTPSFAQVETNFSGGGAVRVGDSVTACAPAIEGAIRFDADGADSLDYCNGANWITLLTSTIGGGVVNGGNSFGAAMTIGTNDTYNLGFETNGVTRLQIDDDSYSVAMGKVPDTTGANSRLFEMKAANNGSTTLRLNASNNSLGANGEIDFQFTDVTVAQIRSQKSNTGLTDSALVFQTHNGTALAESMRITKDGAVGIGTSSPNSVNAGTVVHVHDGTASESSALHFTNAQTGATTTDGAYVGIDTLDKLHITQIENSDIIMSTSALERMRITGAGNVGIGTTTPSESLDVNGNVRVRSDLQLADSDNSNHVGFAAPAIVGTDLIWTLPAADGASGQVLQTNGSGVLSWASAGGGGYSAGDTILAGDGSSAAPSISFANDTTSGFYLAGGNSIGITVNGISHGELTNDEWALWRKVQTGNCGETDPCFSFRNDIDTGMFNPTTNQLGFSTTGTQRMVIDASGNVGIGTNAPTAKLDVEITTAGAPSVLTLSNLTPNSWGHGPRLKFEGVGNAELVSFYGLWDNANSADMLLEVRKNNSMVNVFRAWEGGPGNHPQVSFGGYPVGGEPGGTMGTNSHVRILSESTTGNSVITGLALHHIDSNSAGSNGIGNNISFYAESTVNDTHVETANITSVLTDATNTSKDGNLIFSTLGPNAGAGTTDATEKMRIDSAGNVGIGSSSPAVALDLTGKTSAVRLPAGTTAQRPGTPAGGDIRYNSDDKAVEVYQGSTIGWGGVPSLVAKADLTGQNATIAKTDMFTPTVDGMYSFCMFAAITTTGTSGSITGLIEYEHEDGTTNKQTQIVNLANVTTVTAAGGNCIPLFVASGTAVGYKTTVTGTPGPLQYTLHVRVHRLD